jgi:kynureninase
MKYSLEDIAAHPNRLAERYSQFRVTERYLLTGHSHQAWPDIALSGMQQAWEDAAELVDDKWEKAFQKAEEVRAGFSQLLDDEDGYIALGQNTHELVIRFISSLPLKQKPRLITTDGEFHTIRRQLSRLEEEGIEVVRVPSRPVDKVAENIIRLLDDRVAAVLVSSVFFDTGLINPGIALIAEKCAHAGIQLLVDAYHSLNVAPFSVRSMGLQHAFVTGGGYKYCQLGEGNCFLRFPEHYRQGPVITGWFSEFSLLSGKHGARVEYGRGPDLFAGSTYDPISHYRAAEVFRFFSETGLTPGFLRQVNQHQVGVLLEEFHRLDLPENKIFADESANPEGRAGFLVLFSTHSGAISRELAGAGVLTDYRGNSLRLGPAPYLSDTRLREAMGLLGVAARKVFACSH